MITHKNQLVTITCDKCGHQDTAKAEGYGKVFYNAGWIMSSRANKYRHRCPDCRTKKEKSTREFLLKRMEA